MKIDIIRKAPVDMDCRIIFQEENGALDKVECTRKTLPKTAQCLLQERRFQVRLRGYKKFCPRKWNPTPKHYFIRCRQ